MIGLLFATRNEAAPFLRRIGIPESEGVEGAILPFEFGGASGIVAISGMGRARAAAACARLIEAHGATRIINSGACGALRGDVAPGACFSIDSVHDGEKLLTARDAAPLCPIPWPGLEGASLATVDAGLFDAKRRGRLAETCDLVDMEGIGVAETCAVHGVPCHLIKSVTDAAGPGDRTTLHRNLDAVSDRLAEILLAGLPAFAAPGGILARLHRLTRLEHALFSLPLLFAGAWLGAGGAPSFRDLAWIVVVGTGARTFGMTLNRILDRDLDARNPRTWGRELPAGALSLPLAVAVAAAGLIAYLLGCAALGPLCLALSPVPLLPLALYSLLKRWTSLCHFGIGLCLALAPLGAYVATANALPLTTEILLLGLFTFLWISGFDIIYALLDLESDRRTGVRSLPVALGAQGAIVIAAICHVAAAFALTPLWVRSGPGPAATVAFAVSLAAFGAAYWKRLPLLVRFFPISAIASTGGALVVLLRPWP